LSLYYAANRSLTLISLNFKLFIITTIIYKICDNKQTRLLMNE